MERSEGPPRLNRTQRVLTAVVVIGAVVIAGIGFAGSYSAVRELAIRKGFGDFATVLPIGIDAGIAVLLALDLLLTWLRIPFPMLRQAAWLLTAATIAFNAAAAWPDPIGVGMHGVIPVLFVVTVEAARHAVGRLAAITADRHMEGVRLWRWILAPLPTFRLWRRMKLWEIRKYDEVIQAEQQRLVYQARLRGRFGRGWRWRAPVDELLPLRIARYGIPLEEPAVESEAHLRSAEEKGLEEGDRAETTPVLMRGEGASHLGAVPPDREPRKTAELATQPAVSGGLPTEQQAEADDGQEEAPKSQPFHGATSPENAEDPAPPSPQDYEKEGVTLSTSRRSEVSPKATEANPAESPALELGKASEGTDPPQKGGSTEARGRRVPDMSGQHQADPEHQAAVARLKSNAAAVRYAMSVLGSTHTPTVVDWLAAQGREVNRGQAHRITKEEEERDQRGRSLSTAKSTS
ncbi:DUF2637 domain-containing protein [Streptomyces sp. RM72]|uniref:DUF2637 domain-containing protein n=1 Tax=Streptomyces sp. RM72 TaxID=1115510 RepID=UPI001B39C049|nr:DUF2637 domain-containing protein [Streptomyces sp. RM72]MBQ0890719.1 DUF2637 domain-containing protein [Streptomyces sp. RM72]